MGGLKEKMFGQILINSGSNEEPEELIRYAALIHNSVMTATSTEQWETSCLVNDAFVTTTWLFQDVSDVTFIVFHRVVCQRHLLR
jgi:peroxiredoxin